MHVKSLLMTSALFCDPRESKVTNLLSSQDSERSIRHHLQSKDHRKRN